MDLIHSTYYNFVREIHVGAICTPSSLPRRGYVRRLAFSVPEKKFGRQTMRNKGPGARRGSQVLPRFGGRVLRSWDWKINLELRKMPPAEEGVGVGYVGK